MTYIDVLKKITAVLQEAEDSFIFIGPEIYFSHEYYDPTITGTTWSWNGCDVWINKDTNKVIHLDIESTWKEA